MEGQRLDALSRVLASGPSRRAVLGGVAAAVTARRLAIPAAAVAGEDGWVENEALGGLCRLPRFPCANDGQCCAGGCLADGTCGCRKRGKSAWLRSICCSGKKKRNDKGKCR